MSYTFNQLTSTCKVGSISLKNVGCGCCAIASIAYNLNSSKTLHEDVFKWMVNKGYTISQGSTRDGITAAIKYYGLTLEAYNTSSLQTIMNKIKETGYGILLMHGTGASWCKGKNNYWTKGGHYISITDYNESKGFYVRDSANGRTGYHKLSDFEGDFVSGWAISFPSDEITSKSDNFFDKLPILSEGSKGTAVKVWQSIIGVTVDGDFGPDTLASTKSFQLSRNLTIDGIVNSKTWEAGMEVIRGD